MIEAPQVRPDSDSSQYPMPSWERRDELGFLRAARQTCLEVLFSPRRTFRNMPRDGNIRGALLFAVIIHSALFFSTFIFSFSINIQVPLMVGGAVSELIPYRILLNSLPMVLLTPLAVALLLFVFGMVYYLLLQIKRNTQQSLPATLQVVFYTSGVFGIFYWASWAIASFIPSAPHLMDCITYWNYKTMVNIDGNLTFSRFLWNALQFTAQGSRSNIAPLGFLWFSFCLISGMSSAGQASIGRSTVSFLSICTACVIAAYLLNVDVFFTVFNATPNIFYFTGR